MVKNKTQNTWKKAKKIIPGGNMLLSKRPEIFLPNKWPAYFKKAKDCFVTDLDNKKYYTSLSKKDITKRLGNT